MSNFQNMAAVEAALATEYDDARTTYRVLYTVPSPTFGTTPCARTRDLNGLLTAESAANLAREMVADGYANVRVESTIQEAKRT